MRRKDREMNTEFAKQVIDRSRYGVLSIIETGSGTPYMIGLTVVAEGVEEMRQKEYLKEHGCDIIQGYLLSKPLPQNKAIEFLTHYNG